MGPPLPDPRDQNRNLRLYADAIAAVAKKRGHRFIDLYDRLGDLGKVKGVSDNGIHLTGRGYRWSAPELMAGLGAAVPPATLTLDAAARKGSGSGAKVEWLESASPRFRVRDGLLPQGPRQVILGGLRAGNHSLLSEGKVLATASAAEWAKGIRVERGPEFDRREKLRRTIVAKNVLYFHRWRPENVTYLFGFRKNEQGRNAREIPQFDPLVEAKEKEIVALSGPVAHVYEIRPSGR